MPSLIEASTELVDLTHLIKPLKQKVRQISCSLWNGGHDLYRTTSDSRIYQKCVSCGYETKGWTIDRRDRRLH